MNEEWELSLSNYDLKLNFFREIRLRSNVKYLEMREKVGRGVIQGTLGYSRANLLMMIFFQAAGFLP